MLFAVLLLDHCYPVVYSCFTDILVIGIHAVFHGFKLIADQSFEELIVKSGVLILEFGLAYLLDHFVYKVEYALQMLMSLYYAFIHDLIGDLIRLGLDHDNLLMRGGDRCRHAVGLSLFLSRVEEVFLSVPAENYTGNGAVKRYIRDRNGSAGADHGSDLRGAVSVYREDFDCNDDINIAMRGIYSNGQEKILIMLCGQAGLSFAAHEASGNTSDCIELLVEINREREIIGAVLRACRCSAGHQDCCLTVFYQYCCIAQLREFSDLHAQRPSLIHHFIFAVVREFFVRNFHNIYLSL